MIKNAKFSGYYFDTNLIIWEDFQICISVPLMLAIYTLSDLVWRDPSLFIMNFEQVMKSFLA